MNYHGERGIFGGWKGKFHGLLGELLRNAGSSQRQKEN